MSASALRRALGRPGGDLGPVLGTTAAAALAVSAVVAPLTATMFAAGHVELGGIEQPVVPADRFVSRSQPGVPRLLVTGPPGALPLVVDASEPAPRRRLPAAARVPARRAVAAQPASDRSSANASVAPGRDALAGVLAVPAPGAGPEREVAFSSAGAPSDHTSAPQRRAQDADGQIASSDGTWAAASAGDAPSRPGRTADRRGFRRGGGAHDGGRAGIRSSSALTDERSQSGGYGGDAGRAGGHDDQRGWNGAGRR